MELIQTVAWIYRQRSEVKMGKLQLGWILFPRYDEDYWSSLEAYKKIGYSGMESGEQLLTLKEGTPEENLARFREIGLKVIAVGANEVTRYDEKLIDEKIAQVKLLGADFACCYISSIIRPMMGEAPCTDDEFLQEIENLERSAERFAAAGVKLAYHNHNYEFIRKIHGISAYDQMVSRTSTLCFEPDVGWVTYAGEDPIALLERLQGRLVAVHFKDFIPGRMRTATLAPGVSYTIPDFTAVGSGVVNTFGVAQWAAEHGLTWGVVEQDGNRNLCSVDTLHCAYLNLKESGFAG